MPLDRAKFVSDDVSLTVTDAIDMLWLMVQIGQPVGVAEVVEPEETIVDSTKNVSRVVDQPNELASKTAPLHTKSRRSQETEPESGAGLPIAIADTSALRDALALERSLRPLMRKQPSFTEMILDEEATAISIAEAEQTDESFWIPVLKPVPTRWLEVAFVIEKTERYHLWQPILTEFHQLLERHGAFRNVSLWHIKAGANGEVQIYSKNRQASCKELRDPSGRRLIWLASDCASPIWHNGSLMKVLRDLARVQPVSLLQLLPEQLWARTALGWGVEVKLHSEIPGTPNSQLLKDIPTCETKLNSRQALTLPIVTLEALPLKNWAKVLAGVGGSKTTGLVFLPEDVTPQANISDLTNNELSAKARVSRFRAAASSPLSRELACMMAAAPVSLPVIRLIQQTLLTRSNSVHVTEVLMGGLLKPTKPKMRNGVTEEIGYEFYEGVREELIKITSISKTVDVIQCISEFVNRELRLRQSVRNFDAILFNPDVEIDADYLPFAQITAQTLQLLGGKFAELAQQIYQKIQYPNPTTENPETSCDGLEPEFLDFEFEVVTISMDRTEFDVFLSHSIANRPQVKIIADKLKERGLRPFLDEEQIVLGDLFQERIQKAISQSKSVAVFIDSNGFGAWQATGLDRIIAQNDRQIPVIPVLLPSVNKIPDDLPPFLERLKYVSFKNINDSLAMYHLEWGITGAKPPSMSQSLNNGIILEMKSIPEGSFMMGAPKAEKDSLDRERPQHKVKVPAFMIGKYLITQAQWRMVATLPKVKTELEPDPSNFKGDALPVEQVSWLDAIEFCRRLSNHTGREYRLPSEAEWEYACRAGTTTAYSFGDKADELGEYAWFGENSESQTHPVGQKQPNAFGLYDMHGNVLEWCADDWYDRYRRVPKEARILMNDIRNYEDPKSVKLLRGGAWSSNARNCRSASRRDSVARFQYDSYGFRVVCVLR